MKEFLENALKDLLEKSLKEFEKKFMENPWKETLENCIQYFQKMSFIDFQEKKTKGIQAGEVQKQGKDKSSKNPEETTQRVPGENFVAVYEEIPEGIPVKILGEIPAGIHEEISGGVP